jgi:hypothetical protein
MFLYNIQSDILLHYSYHLDDDSELLSGKKIPTTTTKKQKKTITKQTNKTNCKVQSNQ